VNDLHGFGGDEGLTQGVMTVIALDMMDTF
jgi:hypothetical protein